uniref:Uncharacterized protein n=1 Tax=Anguilla anguilla TaxID=7936 RepID=A0A0E9UPJ9_ANGAN
MFHVLWARHARQTNLAGLAQCSSLSPSSFCILRMEWK